jgi:Domain of unknown function (DUF4180)
MTDQLTEIHGVAALVCAPDGEPVRTEGDAMDLIGAAFGSDAALVVVPVERLSDEFFRLSSGLAGAIVQKFVNYRLRLVIVGDITRHLSRSDAFSDFVRESNRGAQLWFLSDHAELDARLGHAAEVRMRRTGQSR